MITECFKDYDSELGHKCIDTIRKGVNSFSALTPVTILLIQRLFMFHGKQGICLHPRNPESLLTGLLNHIKTRRKTCLSEPWDIEDTHLEILLSSATSF